MWPIVILVGLGIVVLCLGLYFGYKIVSLTKDLQARDDYIRKQGAILGAFMSAIRRGEDLEKFLEKVGDTTDPAALTELYNSLIPSGTDS
jgi:hypothetical protein